MPDRSQPTQRPSAILRQKPPPAVRHHPRQQAAQWDPSWTGLAAPQSSALQALHALSRRDAESIRAAFQGAAQRDLARVRQAMEAPLWGLPALAQTRYPYPRAATVSTAEAAAASQQPAQAHLFRVRSAPVSPLQRCQAPRPLRIARRVLQRHRRHATAAVQRWVRSRRPQARPHQPSQTGLRLALGAAWRQGLPHGKPASQLRWLRWAQPGSGLPQAPGVRTEPPTEDRADRNPLSQSIPRG